MIRPFIAASLIACAAPLMAADDHDHHGAEHLFEIDGLEILHPWTRATQGDEAFVFMELHNEGEDPISLIGAEADFAAKVVLVGFTLAKGTQTVTPLPAVPVAPGRELELAPDIMAIHLTGLTRDLVQGGHAHLHLLTSKGEVDIELAIENADAQQHSHAGHAH